MSDPIEEAVRAALAQVKHLPSDGIPLEATLADLGLDSLDRVTLLFEIEDRLRITIPDDAANRVRSVQDMVDGIRTLTAAQPSAPRA